MHPPPSRAWANFTLMIECTAESSRCYSLYSVVLSNVNTFVSFQSGRTVPLNIIYKMVRKIVYLLVVVGFAVEVVVGGVPAEPPLPGLQITLCNTQIII